MDNKLNREFINKILSDTKEKKIRWMSVRSSLAKGYIGIFNRKGLPTIASPLYTASIKNIGNLYLYKGDTNYAYLLVSVKDTDPTVYEPIFVTDDDELNATLIRLYNIVDEANSKNDPPSLNDLMQRYIND